MSCFQILRNTPSQPQQRHIRHRQEHLSTVGQQDKPEFFVEGNGIFI